MKKKSAFAIAFTAFIGMFFTLIGLVLRELFSIIFKVIEYPALSLLFSIDVYRKCKSDPEFYEKISQDQIGDQDIDQYTNDIYGRIIKSKVHVFIIGFLMWVILFLIMYNTKSYL